MVRYLAYFHVKQAHNPVHVQGSPSTEVRHLPNISSSILTSLPAGLRLADKRSLPCPNRLLWLSTRDTLYEEIMSKSWNTEKQHFGQSYEDNDLLDSSVLIMPLVFFIQPVSFCLLDVEGRNDGC
jgi:GH15 family glucan-1,4-alpha-glucosidase